MQTTSHGLSESTLHLITHKAQLAISDRWKSVRRPCESPSFPRKRESTSIIDQNSLDSRFRGNDGLNKTIHLSFVRNQVRF